MPVSNAPIYPLVCDLAYRILHWASLSQPTEATKDLRSGLCQGQAGCHTGHYLNYRNFLTDAVR